jgi:hypothetical protein
MERIWIVNEPLYQRRDTIPPNRLAEVVCVPNLDELEQAMDPAERPLLLAALPQLRDAQNRFPKALALHLLPPDSTSEQLLLAVRAVLAEARLQHDLEAAESVAWGGGGATWRLWSAPYSRPASRSEK